MTRDLKDSPTQTEATQRSKRTAPRGPEAESGIATIDARRRGSLRRRLLALGDWTARLVALCVATTATQTTDVGTLFWAVLFSPVWILVLKLHGLYDND